MSEMHRVVDAIKKAGPQVQQAIEKTIRVNRQSFKAPIEIPQGVGALIDLVVQKLKTITVNGKEVQVQAESTGNAAVDAATKTVRSWDPVNNKWVDCTQTLNQMTETIRVNGKEVAVPFVRTGQAADDAAQKVQQLG